MSELGAAGWRPTTSPSSTWRPRGPLALCMHGFPDSPSPTGTCSPSWRGPASVPWPRSSAVSRRPSCLRCAKRAHQRDGRRQIALARLAGGVRTLSWPPTRAPWAPGVPWGARRNCGAGPSSSAILPFDIFGETRGTYSQIKKSFYFWYFQMQRVIEDRIRQDDFRFIQDIWGHGSPGTGPMMTWSTSGRRCATRTTCARATASTGDSLTRPASAHPSGPPSRRPPGAAAPRSRRRPARHQRRLPRCDQGAGRAGQGLRRSGLGPGADRGCRALHAGGAARGDQQADHRLVGPHVLTWRRRQARRRMVMWTTRAARCAGG